MNTGSHCYKIKETMTLLTQGYEIIFDGQNVTF